MTSSATASTASRPSTGGQIQKRPVGKSGVDIGVLTMGGHTFIWDPTPTTAQAGEILRYLYENGMTHYDVTYQKERQAYKQVLDQAGLQGKFLPIIWHMDHGIK